jgi:hypothetical protein
MCMLNGKTKFHVQNVPKNTVLLRYNILFVYVFGAVTGSKCTAHLQINQGKSQTINNLVIETFPVVKCFSTSMLSSCILFQVL